MLVALTLAVEVSQPVHIHEGDTAGLYNENCPLAEPAAFKVASPLPQSFSTWVAPAAGPLVAPLSDHPQSSPVPHTDPRAPPAPLA